MSPSSASRLGGDSGAKTPERSISAKRCSDSALSQSWDTNNPGEGLLRVRPRFLAHVSWVTECVCVAGRLALPGRWDGTLEKRVL